MPDGALESQDNPVYRVDAPLAQWSWGGEKQAAAFFPKFQTNLPEAGTVNLPTLSIENDKVNIEQKYRVDSDIARLYEKNRPAIVRINTIDPKADASFSYSAGSGSIIENSGIIATGYHVVKNASSLRVQTQDGKVYEASILAVDAGKDQALVKIKSNNPFASFPTISLADGSAHVGKDKELLGLGFPRNQFALHVSKLSFQDSMKLSDLKGLQGGLLLGEDKDRVLIKSHGPTQNGNSGGPVFDPSTGKQIGMVNLSDKTGTYITPVEDLWKFLAKTKKEQSIGNLQVPASVPAEKASAVPTLPSLPSWGGSFGLPDSLKKLP